MSVSPPMNDPSPVHPRLRPGGRTARIRAQVLDATLAELAEWGFDALTVDAVAERAGVHRATVYRRWHDVAGLITDVFDSASAIDWEPADTGSLYGDLTVLNRELRESLLEVPSLALALIAVSFRSAAAAHALREMWENRCAQCALIVERAMTREEIPQDVDSRALLIASTAPIYHEVVLLQNTTDSRLVERAALAAALAAQAGAYTTAR